jgi:integrase
MARHINRLTALNVSSKIKSKGMYPDGGGLYLRVTEAGTKSWVYRFSVDKKANQMGLGKYPSVSLAEARIEAEKYRKLVQQGISPISYREAERSASQAAIKRVWTFKECAKAYIDAHSPSWKNPKHRAQWPSTLKRYVYPTLGNHSAEDIDVGLVMEVLEPIWHTKTETATRVRGRIEAVLDWAQVRGYRSEEKRNPARWKGRLDKLLPARSKVAKVQHFAALDYNLIGEFMAELRQRTAISAKGLEFLILTATRTSEVMGSTWDEIDMDKAIWIIPADRTKTEMEYRIPLSDDALAVLKEMKEIQVSGYVFPGQADQRPMSNMAFLMLLKRMGHSDLTAHGFRSCFRDWAAERTKYPHEMAEMALGHAIGSKVEAAYRRGDLFEKRCRMMNDWATYTAMPPIAGNVTTLASRA